MRNSILSRVSYHAVYDGSCLDAMRFAKANGFAGVQLADEAPHLSFERLTESEARRIAESLAGRTRLEPMGSLPVKGASLPVDGGLPGCFPR
jgi:hypothetical protein